MKRRRRGEGSFLYDKKRKLFRFSVWYVDPFLGTRKRKDIRAKTRQLLDKKVRAWRRILEEGLSDSGGLMSLEAYCKEFLDQAQYSTKPNTYASYKLIIKNHVLPELGTVKLRDLKPMQLQRWVNKIASQGYKPATVAQIRRTLCTVLNQAVNYRLMPFNPLSATKQPRIPKKLPPVLSREQINKLLDQARTGSFLPPPRRLEDSYYRRCFYTALVISLAAGLRYGECFGLLWSDCDNGKLYIRHNLLGTHITDSPKTDSSVRTVPLPANVWKVLLEWRNEQVVNFGTGSHIVFCTVMGAAIPHYRLSAWWRALMEAADVPPGYRWHNNRATMATQLLAAGVPLKTVAQRLGHANVTITLNKYAGLLAASEDQATDIMADVMQLPEPGPVKKD